MSQSVILPSTLASPSRTFLSPFPPPNQQKLVRDDTTTTRQKKHSICPYKISTDLARSHDIYNKKSPILLSPSPKRSTSLVKACNDTFLLDKCTLSPISTLSSSGDDEDGEDTTYDHDDEDYYDVVSLYYYNRGMHNDNAAKSQDESFSISAPTSLSSYFSSTSSSASSSSSLSHSPPNRVRMRSSISTPLLKTRQSTPVSSSTAAPRLPKWIKHVSQTSGLLEKKLSRGFPFRSTVPVPLHMDGSQDSTTAKALYCGSPLVRHYLSSVTKAERFDSMLQTGFPCPHSLHLYQQDQNDKRNTTYTAKNNYDDDDNPSLPVISKKPRCPPTCHQCGGQQRLMTLRVTLTPLHARANENDIYKSNRKRSRKIRHTTHPITTKPSSF